MTDRQVEIALVAGTLVPLVGLVLWFAPRLLPGVLVAYVVAYMAGRKE